MASGLRSWRHGMSVAGVATISIGCSGSPSGPDGIPDGNGTSQPGPRRVAEDGTSTDGSNLAAAIAAATSTAETHANCVAIAPFYWELGDTNGPLVSGSVGSAAPTATSPMAIASGSKWLFGAYAVEAMGTMPDATRIPFLNFTSGYVGLDACPPSGTVDDCLTGAAGTPIAAEVGRFDYDGAHLQKLASSMGLGSYDSATLAAAVKSEIGADLDIEYTEPQPASGVETSADDYASFLRRLLVGSPTPLLLGSLLGEAAVCTNPATCATAIFSPITGSATSPESWHYSLAHWIEDDPDVGDGAFSSAGAFGFYPWVNAARTLYGVLAREAPFTGHNGYDSAVCGRSIREAWAAGVAQ